MFPIRDHNPSERMPWVTWGLIAANVAIWVWMEMALRDDASLGAFYYRFAMFPAGVVGGEGLHTLVTATFLHAGFLHLAGNMLFLWIFGDNLEDQMGHGPYLVFYIACGAAANVAQILPDPMSPIPVVGASGAIAGVMGGYLLLFPRAKVDMLLFLLVFVRIFKWPAWVMLGIWFAFQVVRGIGDSGAGGGVAYWAHAGGFVVGLVLTLPLFWRRGGRRFWDRTHGQPPHPEARYRFEDSTVPKVTRRR
ncbi:rhomboid family intramembrane serine protease [Pseudoroseicyclus sp. CXY001]|uniref:rhomboid family intramembrane serine protease n=1 Tax=Pseudoroseicyclus sp. CXY001 TaxID=3242492 RepID=UPI00358DB742